MKGAAVVTRKGSFMADKTVFLKKGFEAVDKAKPDFELLAKKLDTAAADPRFKPDMTAGLGKYGSGLTVLRSPQCPYTEKNVAAILEAAKDEFGLEPALIDLEDAEAAQNAPCPFGTFGIVYDGKVISHHPISKTRFVNIMKSLRGA
jgi:hypothetical protein